MLVPEPVGVGGVLVPVLLGADERGMDAVLVDAVVGVPVAAVVAIYVRMYEISQ